MAKVVPIALMLDDEVAALVKRIAAQPSPGSYIVEYGINRVSGSYTTVTVSFVADEEFSKRHAESEETKA